uniref:Uncharacterized protein n=1 Tax=Anguilla anguilla TaxID=7936 RepID=A0A0E9TFQ8_ANGAN
MGRSQFLQAELSPGHQAELCSPSRPYTL